MSFVSFSSFAFQRRRSRRRCSASASSNSAELHVLGLGVGLGDARALVFQETADRLGLGVADCGQIAYGASPCAPPRAARSSGSSSAASCSAHGPDPVDDRLGRRARLAESVIQLLERRRLPHGPERLQCVRPDLDSVQAAVTSRISSWRRAAPARRAPAGRAARRAAGRRVRRPPRRATGRTRSPGSGIATAAGGRADAPVQLQDALRRRRRRPSARGGTRPRAAAHRRANPSASPSACGGGSSSRRAPPPSRRPTNAGSLGSRRNKARRR